jgi:hypothetical protein
MSTKKHSFERRTDKLRASCDACYLAKVKCSKSRPLCQRCLVSGTNCAYSPSARFKRGPKMGGGDRLNEEAVSYRTQKNSEADSASSSSAGHFGPPSFQDHNIFNSDEQYPTPASTPCPGHWASDLLACAQPVLLDGEAASELYTGFDGFGLPDPCSWWNNTSTMEGNVTDGDLNGSYMQLESSEPTLSYCCPSWYQSPRSGPGHLPSNSINMSSIPSSGTGTYCGLDFGSFDATGGFSALQLSQMKDAGDTLQYESQEH